MKSVIAVLNRPDPLNQHCFIGILLGQSTFVFFCPVYLTPNLASHSGLHIKEKSHGWAYKQTMGVKCPSKCMGTGAFCLGCYCLSLLSPYKHLLKQTKGFSAVWHRSDTDECCNTVKGMVVVVAFIHISYSYIPIILVCFYTMFQFLCLWTLRFIVIEEFTSTELED